MGLSERWINLRCKAGSSQKSVRVFMTVLGVILYATYVLLYIFAALWVDELFHFPQPFGNPSNILLSIPFIGISLYLLTWSILHFSRRKGAPTYLNPPPKLIADGPYAYIRNPMHTGAFFMGPALGLLLNSISLVFIFSPLFILVNLLELKFFEEPELERRFGRDYLEYKKSVPRFIPHLSK